MSWGQSTYNQPNWYKMDRQALQKAVHEMELAYEFNKMSDLEYGVQNGAPPLAPWPEQPCRILFLDFDGVLNREVPGHRSDQFLPQAVAALNQILLATKALIVISSSWRLIRSLRENANFLEGAGVAKGHVVGKTPMLGCERGYEIDAWLRGVPYPVKSFVILDNHNDMGHLRFRLVQTASEHGLTMSEAYQVVQMFRTES